jgi:hypothetical protein
MTMVSATGNEALHSIATASRPVCVHCGAKYGQRVTRTVWVRRGQDEEPQGVVKRYAVRPHIGGQVQDVEVWDGKSWMGGYEPFCTLRCALSYARKAYARR